MEKEDHFKILDVFKTQISATLESAYAEKFFQCQIFVSDLGAWVDCLKDIPQSLLLRSALNECATANLFCSFGLYKHAMISLRLCLEHCLYAIYMSSNDFYFRRWKSGQEDMKWTAILDTNTGIFSKSFIRAYAPEFEERSMELSNIARTVYRECSEYIHGNFSKMECLPEQNEFSQDLLSRYVDHFETISYLLSVCLVIRFKEKILKDGLLGNLEDAIMHNISMLPEIQLLYDEMGE